MSEKPSQPENTIAQVTETQTLTGYELVADMMERQDVVIAELDLLNSRIETAIKEITAARKLEEAALATEDDATDDAESAAPIERRQAA